MQGVTFGKQKTLPYLEYRREKWMKLQKNVDEEEEWWIKLNNLISSV